MALGAERADVLQLVMRESMILVLARVLLGTLAVQRDAGQFLA